MRDSPLLVFADDWGRHPSSAQHLTRRLLDWHPVAWVNTIGTRKPAWNWGTVCRGLEKLRHWSAATAEAPSPAPWIVNPFMWPWFTAPWDRALNRMLLCRALKPLLDAWPEPPVAVTTLPIVADLMDKLPVAKWVYYCVDDFAQWPGLDGEALRRMERDLVARADSIVAVSETLQDRLSGMGRESLLLTHGVDLDFWQAPTPCVRLDDLPRPLVLFWGVIDRRMDVSLVRRLANDMTAGTIVFVGPREQPDPELAKLARVALLPALPFEQLPGLAQCADVLVMPYADLPVTRAMQPLKLKEYLATGKPVVVRDLPATRGWHDCLDLANSAAEFSLRVRARLRDGVPDGQRLARARLADESWDTKARAFEDAVFASCEPRRRRREEVVAHA